MAQGSATTLLVWGVLVAAAATGATARTTITYTRSATDLANIWVEQSDFEVMGGSKAPKFTGSAVSCGIIRWDATDDHVMNPTDNGRGPISAVLTTGDAKWAISKVPYKGGDVKPSYPDIVNSNIKGSHDAVVLDFWVRAKVGGPASVIGHLSGASNEGSPAAIKRHGGGPYDTFHFEIDGKIVDSASFERIWYDSFECDFCAPPKPGQWPKMHYWAKGDYSQEASMPSMVKGRLYHVKLRLADTRDRSVDSALYLRKGGLRAWG